MFIQRLEKIFELMENEIGALQVEKRVRNRVKRPDGEDAARVLSE
jgi:ATP-dependent Lon protease